MPNFPIRSLDTVLYSKMRVPVVGYELRVDNVPTTVPLHQAVQQFKRLLKPPGKKWISYHLTLSPAKRAQDKHGGSGVIAFQSKEDAKMLAFRISRVRQFRF